MLDTVGTPCINPAKGVVIYPYVTGRQFIVYFTHLIVTGINYGITKYSIALEPVPGTS